MGFNKTLLALAIPLAIVGCGGSSGGSNNDNKSVDDDNGQPTTTDPISFSGRVADGYLSNATVCIDINENKKCDDSDPSATSVAGGKFTIDDATQAQRDKFPLLVEIKVGETIDEDNEGITLNKPLVLSAPAGYDFISPLSTMVQNNVEAGISKEDAEKIVQGKLDTKLDLNTDYVAGKDSGDNAEEYARLHQVAQVTARVISDNMDTLADAAKENDISIDDLISAIVDEVFDALEEITAQVQEVAADTNTEFKPDTLAETVSNELIGLDSDNINDVVDQNEALEAATAFDAEALLASEALYGFETELNEDYQGSFHASYGLITKNEQLLAEPANYAWDASTSAFIAGEDEDDSDVVHVLNSSGTWTRIPNFWTPTSFSGGTDGTFTVIRDRNGVSVTQVFELQEVNLEGLNVRSVMNKVDDGEKGIWGNYLPSTAVFPTGSKGYTFKLADGVANNDFYIMEDYDCDDAATRGGICTNANVHSPSAVNGLATSFNDFKVDTAYTLTDDANADAEGIIGVEIAYSESYSKALRAEILTNKTVNFYSIEYNDDNTSVKLLGSSTWSLVPGSTVALEIEWTSALQEFDGYKSNRDNPVLALISGYVRNAEHEGVRPQPIEKADLPFLNATAKEVALQGFDPSRED